MWKIDVAKMWSLGTFTVPPPTPSPDRLLKYQTGTSLSLQETLWSQRFEHWVHERVAHHYAWHVRGPHHVWSMWTELHQGPDYNEVQSWHQDGTDGYSYLGLWSNTFGSEIRVKDSRQRRIYQALPGEFLLINNEFFQHRVPLIPDMREDHIQDRWFVRFHTRGAIKQHPDVRLCELSEIS